MCQKQPDLKLNANQRLLKINRDHKGKASDTFQFKNARVPYKTAYTKAPNPVQRPAAHSLFSTTWACFTVWMWCISFELPYGYISMLSGKAGIVSTNGRNVSNWAWFSVRSSNYPNNTLASFILSVLGISIITLYLIMQINLHLCCKHSWKFFW